MAIFGRKKKKGRASDGAVGLSVPSSNGALPDRRVVSAPMSSTPSFASTSRTTAGSKASQPNNDSMGFFSKALSSIPDDEVAPLSPQVPIDDFGRPILKPIPALSNASIARSHDAATRNLQRYAIGDDDDAASAQDALELQLLYGYAPLYPALELSVIEVADICELCCHHLTLKGLDTPLLLSSMALDLGIEGPSGLARSYIKDKDQWVNDVALAHPLSLAAHIKWALARLRPPAGQTDRGFVSYKDYETFRSTEQGLQYPPLHMPSHFAARLGPDEQRLFGILLSFFSSVAAHSTASGCTPRRIASLFSPYIFGLPNDKSFDATYDVWLQHTAALEHVLVAFMRAQKENMPVFPTHLEKFMQNYPTLLELHPTPAKPSKNAKLEDVLRIRRFARFHSKDLIQTAETWTVPQSQEWASLLPNGQAKPRPTFTADYKQMLNIQPYQVEDEDDQSILQKYKTSTDKSWGEFGQSGFKDVDRNKLEFDLTEGERETLRQKRQSVDWQTFETAGFGEREAFGAHDLIFHQSIAQQVKGWSSHQQTLDTQVRQTEKALPAFKHDTTPHERARVTVDANFFESWADVLVGSGWMRDEMKEWNWALIQYKARPRDGEAGRNSPGKTDDRIASRWVLVEEQVPSEYLQDLRSGKVKKKRQSFLKTVSVRRKNSRLASRLRALPITPEVKPPAQETIHESQRLHPSLTNDAFEGANPSGLLLPGSRIPTDYAPSFVSTTGAGHGHGSVATPSLVNGEGVNMSQVSVPMSHGPSGSTVHVQRLPTTKESETPAPAGTRPASPETSRTPAIEVHEEPQFEQGEVTKPLPAPVENIASRKPAKKSFLGRLKTIRERVSSSSSKKQRDSPVLSDSGRLSPLPASSLSPRRESIAPFPKQHADSPYDGIAEGESTTTGPRESIETADGMLHPSHANNGRALEAATQSSAMSTSESGNEGEDSQIVTDARRIKVVGRISSEEINRSGGGEDDAIRLNGDAQELSQSPAMSEFKSRVSSIAKQFEEREKELRENQARLSGSGKQ